jgi:streptogramin lyase
MTLGSAPLFSDADVRRYLAARAEAVATHASPADDMDLRVAAQLGLVRRRRSVPVRALRLAVVVALLAALIVSALYLIGHLREDYAPQRPEVTVQLHGSPWGIAVLAGSVWTAGYLEPVLFEIDPRTGEVRREYPTGKRTCGELAAAFGKLWFTTCPDNAYLSRFDPASGKISRLNGYGGDRLAFGADRVWIGQPGAVEGINPATMATEIRIPVERAGLLAYGFGAVWISDADGGVVARVDPDSGRTLAEISWPGVSGSAPSPVYISVGNDAVWVVDESALAVYRIDPITNLATRADIELEAIDGTGFGDHPIAFGAGELWVRETEASIAQINPATLAVVERVTTGPFGGGAFVVTREAFWYTNLKGESIVGLHRS